MYSYYYEFGKINSEKIFFYNLNQELEINDIDDFKVEKKGNKLMILLCSIFYFVFIILHFVTSEEYFYEILLLITLVFFYLIMKFKFIFFVVLIDKKNKSIIIPMSFFSEQKAVRYTKRLINKILSLKNKKNNSPFYFI